MASQPGRKSNASRYLFLFLLGLLVGGVGTVMIMRALQARQDPFPDSLMNVMSKQSALLKRNLEQNRCDATDTLPRLQSLRFLSNDLELGFPGLSDDPRFAQHAGAIRAALDASLANTPADCQGLTTALATIHDGCKACHQDFH